MLKVATGFFAAWIVLSWGAVVYDLMNNNDAHAFKIMSCMAGKRKALDISPEEAYLVCEKEVR